MEKCCLCNEEYSGWGNNAEPLVDGRCCDECNWSKVIPSRLQNALLGYKSVVIKKPYANSKILKDDKSK